MRSRAGIPRARSSTICTTADRFSQRRSRKTASIANRAISSCPMPTCVSFAIPFTAGKTKCPEASISSSRKSCRRPTTPHRSQIFRRESRPNRRNPKGPRRRADRPQSRDGSRPGQLRGCMKQRPGILVCDALVCALFLALASTLCIITHWRYAIFRNAVDPGIFTQAIGGLGHGFSSTAEGGVNHLLVHWSPIVAIAWPFLRAFGPVGLEYFQAILVAAVVFPIWGLARARLRPVPALALVVVAALYPVLCANAVGDFHEMAFVPLLSATLVYALDRRRWTLGLVSVVLLACTKEDQFVVLAGVGIACVAFGRRDAAVRRFGLLTTGIAAATALAYFGIVRDAIQPHVGYAAIHFFDWGSSPVSTGTLPALI